MLAATAAALSASLCSSEILELISWASVESCDVEAEELTERVLSEGDSKLEFLTGYVGAGARLRPLPRTRPPPSFREDIFYKELEAHKINCSQGTCQAHNVGAGLAESDYRNAEPDIAIEEAICEEAKMGSNFSTLQCPRSFQLSRGVAH